MVGVAAQEAERVRASRHPRQIALLEREQVARLDAQMLRDVVQIRAAPQALLAQLRAQLAHQAPGGVVIYGFGATHCMAAAVERLDPGPLPGLR